MKFDALLVVIGVIWAGAQPAGPNTPLDEAWVARLQDILTVCHGNDIYVILDIHQVRSSAQFWGHFLGVCPTQLTQIGRFLSDSSLNKWLAGCQDALGTAMCGEGMPMWFSTLATPDLIGRPLIGRCSFSTFYPHFILIFYILSSNSL